MAGVSPRLPTEPFGPKFGALEFGWRGAGVVQRSGRDLPSGSRGTMGLQRARAGAGGDSTDLKVGWRAAKKLQAGKTHKLGLLGVPS